MNTVGFLVLNGVKMVVVDCVDGLRVYQKVNGRYVSYGTFQNFYSLQRFVQESRRNGERVVMDDVLQMLVS